MLTFRGQPHNFCDGIVRRDFLKVGALAIGGLTLADILRLRAQAATNVPPTRRVSTTKSVIMIYLPGGPTHMDTYDLKPEAPVEYRGEFKAITTNVPGVNICELMPRQASIMDKLSIVRGVNFSGSDHSAHLIMTGVPTRISRPSFGSVVSYMRRGKQSMLPPYVSLSGMNDRQSKAEEPAYAGRAHRPFVPSGPGLDNLGLVSGVSLDRMQDRKSLLKNLDTLRRDVDVDGSLAGVDAFNAKALDMVTSSKTREAFDVSMEGRATRERYGEENNSFLQARRLVEAGVSVVTLSTGGWDSHSQNFASMRRQLPRIDKGIHALVTDLHERGLGDDVAVVMWGEFGRTPRVNMGAGRDHWPAAGFALMAGGRFGDGRVIGETDSTGSRAKGQLLTPSNVLTSLYQHLGVDPALTIPDMNGRPMYLLDERTPLEAFV